MPVITTKGLIKRFRDIVAVDGIDLDIEEGECFGLLGPNGAGKTTLIRMITAVSPPTAGEITVLGKELSSHARSIKAVIGVVPQKENFDPDLNVLKNLTIFARYYNIPKAEALRRSMEVLKFFQLEERYKSKIDELSGGMKRRLLIARGLINEPKILILDEPSIGLDPQAKHLVWQKLMQLKKDGVTLVLPTQNMEEARVLCDRIAIMHQGKIIALDTPSGLISHYTGPYVWEIGLESKAREQAAGILTSEGLEFEMLEDRIHIFHLESSERLKELFRSSERFWKRDSTLEDVFFRLTGRLLIE